jgi:rhodanese-related sulfurtransferase
MMQNKYILVLIALLLTLFSSGQNKWGFETMVKTLLSNKVDTISSQQLSKMMSSGEVLLLDSRASAEFEVSHIRGAKHIGYEFPDYDVIKGADKSKPVVVYCSVGKRSEDIGFELKKRGFTTVYNLFGGIFDWTNRGFTVVNSEGAEVTKVHPYSTTWGIWINNYEKDYGTE